MLECTEGALCVYYDRMRLAAQPNCRLAHISMLHLCVCVWRYKWALERMMTTLWQPDPVIWVDALCPDRNAVFPESYLPDLTRFFLLAWKATNKTTCSYRWASTATRRWSLSESTVRTFPLFLCHFFPTQSSYCAPFPHVSFCYFSPYILQWN